VVRIAIVAPILVAMSCALFMPMSPGERGNITPEEIDRRSESMSLGCSRTPIDTGNDPEAVVDAADPLGTATSFCLEAATYLADKTAVLRQGNKLAGPAGKVSTRGRLDPSIQNPPPWCPDTPNTTHILEGDDLDAKINGSNATFCVHAGTYPIDNMVTVAQGDHLYAQPGTIEKDIRLPSGHVVYDRTAAVKLTNAGNLTRMVNVTATSATIDWLGGGGAVSVYVPLDSPECINPSEKTGKCARVGTGMFLAAGAGGANVKLSNLDISRNAANCVTGLHGILIDSELSNCSTDDTYDDFSSAAVKTTFESEYARNYVHDTGSNGLWCDQGCHDVAERKGGFWVHDNLIVNNDGWGVRYEFSPMVAEGVHAASPSALVENNYIAANSIGGASMVDAQNGTFRNNSFGPQTVGGVAYGADGNNGLAMLFEDSGRASRTDLWNADTLNNLLNGEVIKGCELPDNVVYCHHDNAGRGFPWPRRASIAALAATSVLLVLYTIHRTRFLITGARVTPSGLESESGNDQEEVK